MGITSRCHRASNRRRGDGNQTLRQNSLRQVVRDEVVETAAEAHALGTRLRRVLYNISAALEHPARRNVSVAALTEGFRPSSLSRRTFPRAMMAALSRHSRTEDKETPCAHFVNQ